MEAVHMNYICKDINYILGSTDCNLHTVYIVVPTMIKIHVFQTTSQYLVII
jgi:hypothetical protein